MGICGKAEVSVWMPRGIQMELMHLVGHALKATLDLQEHVDKRHRRLLVLVIAYRIIFSEVGADCKSFLGLR